MNTLTPKLIEDVDALREKAAVYGVRYGKNTTGAREFIKYAKSLGFSRDEINKAARWTFSMIAFVKE